MRIVKLALENCIGRKLGADSCVIPWLIEHAGNILSLFEVGSDGRNPYQRLRGKKMKQPLVEFGESVHFLIPDHGSLGKMESKWRNGIYLGIRMESSEMLVGTSEGVFKVRSIRRKPDGQRWDADQVCSVIGVPWKPYQFTDNDRLLIRLQKRSDSKEVEVKERPPDEDPAPRGIIIGKKDLITHGYTPSCPGCYAARHNIKYKPQTPECRERIYRALQPVDSNSKRVRDAKFCEDSWIERRVIEGEVAKPEERQKLQG